MPEIGEIKEEIKRSLFGWKVECWVVTEVSVDNGWTSHRFKTYDEALTFSLLLRIGEKLKIRKLKVTEGTVI